MSGENKSCEQCGVVFFRPANCSSQLWHSRRFCSHHCSSTRNFKSVTLKNCPVCGGVVQRRKGQSPYSYNNQKYCSRSCGAKKGNSGMFAPGSGHKLWSGGLHKKRGYFQILISLNSYRPLHIILMEWYLGRELEQDECVHHCNRNTEDNRLDNLELMTKSTHAKLHGAKTFKRKDVQEKSKLARRGLFKKESHPQWKSHVTKQKIEEALLTHRTQKEAAQSLGICADTLRARVKHINLSRSSNVKSM